MLTLIAFVASTSPRMAHLLAVSVHHSIMDSTATATATAILDRLCQHFRYAGMHAGMAVQGMCHN